MTGGSWLHANINLQVGVNVKGWTPFFSACIGLPSVIALNIVSSLMAFGDISVAILHNLPKSVAGAHLSSERALSSFDTTFLSPKKVRRMFAAVVFPVLCVP